MNILFFLNQVRAGCRPVHAWFLKIVSLQTSICVCVCVCVCLGVCVCDGTSIYVCVFGCVCVTEQDGHLSYMGGCGVHECMHIETFKRRAGLGYG